MECVATSRRTDARGLADVARGRAGGDVRAGHRLFRGFRRGQAADHRTRNPRRLPACRRGGVLPNAPQSVEFVSFDATTGLLAAIGPDRTTVAILNPDDADPPRAVTLPAPAAGLSPGKPGEVLVPAGSAVVRVDLATGAVTEVAVEGDATSVALDQHGDLVVGDADGTIRIPEPHHGDRPRYPPMRSPPSTATSSLDRRQSSVTEIDDGSTSLARPAGGAVPPTSSPTTGAGCSSPTPPTARCWCSPRDRLVLRQRYPVGSSP